MSSLRGETMGPTAVFMIVTPTALPLMQLNLDEE